MVSAESDFKSLHHINAGSSKMTLDQAYSLLGFDSFSVPNEKEVSLRYRELIMKYHPDKLGPEGAEMSIRLNQAKEMVTFCQSLACKIMSSLVKHSIWFDAMKFWRSDAVDFHRKVVTLINCVKAGIIRDKRRRIPGSFASVSCSRSERV